MKSKILTIFMLMILVLNLFAGLSIADCGGGSQVDFCEDFEDDVLTQQSEDHNYGDKWITSCPYAYTHNYVHNAQVLDTRSYRVYRNEKTNFNFSYSSNEIITSIHFRIWCYGWNTNSDRYIYLRNSSGSNIFKMQLGGDMAGSNEFQWSELGSYEYRGFDIPAQNWLWINITINDNDSTNVSVQRADGTSEWFEPDAPPNVVTDDNRIVSMHVGSNQDLTAMDNWVDNIKITTGEGTSESDEPTIPPCTPYSTIGNIGVGTTAHTVGVKYLWSVYYVETRMYVHRLDMEVLEDYANQITVSDIQAKLGTYNLGNPNSMVEFSDGHYRISWTGLNCYINNTPCPIMFKFKKNIGTSQYPQYAIPYFTSDDLNEDGFQKCVMCDSEYDSYWDNFKDHIDEMPPVPIFTTTINYINELLNYLYSYTYVINNFEPVIRLCADRLTTGELKYHFENDIWCYPRTFKNNSFTRIGYTVNLSQMGEENKVIMIEEPDHNVKTIKTISTQSGGVIYSAHQIGLHYANLSLGGVNVSSTTFTTVGNLDDWLETNPNPSYPNQDFDIIYNYSKTGNGVIRIFDSDDFLLKTFIVNPNTEYGKETTSLDEGKYYIKLQEIVEIAGKNNYVTLFPYTHAVQGDVVPYIEVEQEVTTVDYGFRVYGEHNHVGHNIVVRVGDSEEIDVSDKTGFNFMHDIEQSGYYRISLILKKPDYTEVELDWDYVTVKSTLFEDVEKTGLENIMDMIPDFYKVLGGIILTILLTLSPFIFQLKASKYIRKPININIPPITYPLLYIGGTILSLVLGLYGIEIFFLFVAGGFVSIIFLYVSGMKSGGNGNE